MCAWLANLMTNVNALATITLKELCGKTPIKTCLALHWQLCSNYLKALICIMRLEFVSAKTEVLDNSLSCTVRVTRTSSWLKNCPHVILVIMSSCCSSVSSDTISCTMRTGTGGELYETIFLLLGKMLLLIISRKNEQKRTENSQILDDCKHDVFATLFNSDV